MKLEKQAGTLTMIVVARSKTNCILRTNPENFEHGKRMRHHYHIEDEPHAIWTEAYTPLWSSTLRFDAVFILALSLVSRKKQILLSS
jgi:hypothetical protein